MSLDGRQPAPFGRLGDQHTELPPAPPSAQLPSRLLILAGPAAIGLVALVLRLLMAGNQSAYIDEAGQILAGRTLIEQGKDYANILSWSYGSYLWPLVAGAADIAGGLVAVRAVTALCGVVMTFATAAAAFRLAPASLSPSRRWSVALLAGLTMAVFPTAIGVGRFGTYDALAGAGFMGGVALYVPLGRNKRPATLLASALLLFVAFLSKYVIAIYFPVLCIALILSDRSVRGVLRNLCSFILPLSALCVGYFLLFTTQLTYLLRFSTEYTDLKSATPLREYVWQRPEIWILAALALVAGRRATRQGRAVSAAGVAIIMAFHALARPDFDFWKHSIYLIFFLAPMAALLLLPVAEHLVRSALAAFGWRRATGTERVVARIGIVAVLLLQLRLWPELATGWRVITVILLSAGLAGLVLAPLTARMIAPWDSRRPGVRTRAAGLALLCGLALPLPVAAGWRHALPLTVFYPNLNGSIEAIRANAAGAHTVLTDDTALRYYLFREVQPEHVTDPFFVTYGGLQGIDGYRAAIIDEHFDVLYLDGGIGPVASQINHELKPLIAEHYRLVYSRPTNLGATVEIYRPRGRAGAEEAVFAPNAIVYTFDTGVNGWGAHPESGNQLPGLAAQVDSAHTWDGHPVLRFSVTPERALVAIPHTQPVRKVSAYVYIDGNDPNDPGVGVGMVGFDAAWTWHDDGYRQRVFPGRWRLLTWELPEPGVYNEIGLAFNAGAGREIYIGQVVVEP